jgi:hypothetical protein
MACSTHGGDKKYVQNVGWNMSRDTSMHLLPYCMKLCPSWEAANCAATQELPNILWKPKEGSLPWSQEPSTRPYPQSDQFSPQHPILFKIHFNIIHLHMSRTSYGLSPSGFPISIPYAFLYDLDVHRLQYDMRLLTGLSWLRIGSSAGILWT